MKDISTGRCGLTLLQFYDNDVVEAEEGKIDSDIKEQISIRMTKTTQEK